jgi:acyl-CoA synthetase (AMP-forming)/AMP-acid ligase II
MVVRYANWFLELGVERDECVAFYLQNSAEFMFAWMGLLVMNAYPAMVNFNLEGGGLVHCVRISKARIILIDDELARRVLENDNLKSLGLQMLVLNDDLKTQIEGRAARDLPESVTHGSNEMSAVALRYTRHVWNQAPGSTNMVQWNNWLPEGGNGSPWPIISICDWRQIPRPGNSTSTEW